MKIKKLKKSGFSLIELLVVIAIIGILSAIVLSSLTSARAQAFDAKVKGQLNSIRSAAESYFLSNGSYGAPTIPTNLTAGCTTVGSMFTDVGSGMSRLSISANYPVGANTIQCNSTTTSYAVSDNLSSTSTYWCVDSNGTSKQELVPLGVASTSCL